MNMELSSSAIVDSTKRRNIYDSNFVGIYRVSYEVYIYLGDVTCSGLIYNYYDKSQYNYTKQFRLCDVV